MLAVMLACTDAALGQAVVTDRRCHRGSDRVQNVESGLNDGLCVPLFLIAIAFADAEEGACPAHGAVTLVLGEIGYGLVGVSPRVCSAGLRSGWRPAVEASSRVWCRS